MIFLLPPDDSGALAPPKVKVGTAGSGVGKVASGAGTIGVFTGFPDSTTGEEMVSGAIGGRLATSESVGESEIAGADCASRARAGALAVPAPDVRDAVAAFKDWLTDALGSLCAKAGAGFNAEGYGTSAPTLWL